MLQKQQIIPTTFSSCEKMSHPETLSNLHKNWNPFIPEDLLIKFQRLLCQGRTTQTKLETCFSEICRVAVFRIGLHDALHSLHIFLFPPISFLTSFSHCLEAFLMQLCNKLYLNHVQISRETGIFNRKHMAYQKWYPDFFTPTYDMSFLRTPSNTCNMQYDIQ